MDDTGVPVGRFTLSPNRTWEYKVQGVTVEQGVIQLRYTVTSKTTPDTTFACPLIVSVPKGEYTAVVFVEDGNKVRTVNLDSDRGGTDPRGCADHQA